MVGTYRAGYHNLHALLLKDRPAYPVEKPLEDAILENRFSLKIAYGNPEHHRSLLRLNMFIRTTEKRVPGSFS